MVFSSINTVKYSFYLLLFTYCRLAGLVGVSSTSTPDPPEKCDSWLGDFFDNMCSLSGVTRWALTRLSSSWFSWFRLVLRNASLLWFSVFWLLLLLLLIIFVVLWWTDEFEFCWVVWWLLLNWLPPVSCGDDTIILSEDVMAWDFATNCWLDDGDIGVSTVEEAWGGDDVVDASTVIKNKTFLTLVYIDSWWLFHKCIFY